MRLRNKTIALVDSLQEAKSGNSFVQAFHEGGVVILDPVSLFSKSNWIRFEEDIDVINKVYSHLFDEVVIARKKLICFWPLTEQLGSEWVSLNALCDENGYELEAYRNVFLDGDGYGFSSDVLRLWKSFVYFLIESLLEDIKLNEGLEEIAKLTSDHEAIVLFKVRDAEKINYTYAVCHGVDGLLREKNLQSAKDYTALIEFGSFQDMLVGLLDSKDLSQYQTEFADKHLEKDYFKVIAQKTRTKNLIESWLKTYSLN
jgi:hypothetical protein